MASSYTLGSHYESFIKEMVESGRYSTASEVMRDSLRLMEEREQMRSAKLEALRQLVREGLDSGPSEDHDMDDILATARRERQREKAGRANGK
ncbi:type II toxin-antitoxin system ParD family antitoxin [Bosea vaviloviae]|jgi:antitoxin ParD1/3/4|uniref:CopG family transcriptional regulator n=1 Tax=Bosea vaviloviae TaxID=1526658 RepID=A0A1D7U6L6_9HYPH|nr:type II toxin-antitoxin system ParD family antitoxin [Bosea vaviloviae]AOO83028.1 CopG family transcriptional regulator [Bosea vaviloviae]